MKLEELTQVSVGRNVSRISDNEVKLNQVYTNDDLLADLCVPIGKLKHTDRNRIPINKYSVVAGELVYSLVSSTAGIVSQQNSGKIINQNFARISPLSDQINLRYLCYILNESIEVKRQMAILMQGTVVRKLKPSMLRELQVEFKPFELQEKIGEAYFNFKRYQYLTERESELQGMIYLDALQKLNGPAETRRVNGD